MEPWSPRYRGELFDVDVRRLSLSGIAILRKARILAYPTLGLPTHPPTTSVRAPNLPIWLSCDDESDHTLVGGGYKTLGRL
jgi:hypothetical protein